MKTLKFKVKAKSNLIFIASSNTEGNIRYLDYIPGSVFLGIVAKHYDEFENPFKIFHSGNVRFSDANIIINKKPSFKIPLSIHTPKLKKNVYFNYYFLKNDDFQKYKQFKQIREGYFNKDLIKKNVEFDYSLKSARDYEKGRSKQSAMFGYKSIVEGSEFLFEIKLNDTVTDKEINKIKKFLIGEKKVGKSKSAEYSLINIEEYEFDNSIKTVKNEDKVYLYAKSRVCLVDENGLPTYDIKYLHSALKKENIVYEESFLRYYEYSPYNQKRNSRDSMRCVIDKGSVFVLQNINEKILNDIVTKGVGVFKNEGFGEIIANPFFLLNKMVEFKEYDKDCKENTSVEIKSYLGKVLQNKKIEMDNKNELIKKVNDYIKHNSIWFSNISSSQWGNIRILSKKYKENAFDYIKEYISSGIKQWREDQQEKLLSFIKTINYKGIIYLATEMAKLKDKQ